MSDEVSDRLYNEMRDNRLHNCLLNTDEDDVDVSNDEKKINEEYS
jgi:hypothetical protein